MNTSRALHPKVSDNAKTISNFEILPALNPENKNGKGKLERHRARGKGWSCSDGAHSIFPFLRVVLFGLLAPLLVAGDPVPSKTFPPIALVNRVTFKDPKFNNDLAGCAFLVEHQGKVYACTCKHALWVTKSEAMKGVHFEGTLLEWRMERKDDSRAWVRTGKLLNENREEPIGPNVVQADWLIFDIEENHSQVKPLTLRTSAPVPGEALYFIGWSFKDKTGPQRVYRGRLFKTSGSKLLMEDLDEPPNKAGMSGGAVVDKDGLLVGIVSDYTKDEETGRWFASPCSADYLARFFGNRQAPKTQASPSKTQ